VLDKLINHQEPILGIHSHGKFSINSTEVLRMSPRIITGFVACLQYFVSNLRVWGCASTQTTPSKGRKSCGLLHHHGSYSRKSHLAEPVPPVQYAQFIFPRHGSCKKRRDCDHLKSRGAPSSPEQRDEHDAVLWPISTKDDDKPVTGPEMCMSSSRSS
jgi:hypothetical protein